MPDNVRRCQPFGTRGLQVLQGVHITCTPRIFLFTKVEAGFSQRSTFIRFLLHCKLPENSTFHLCKVIQFRNQIGSCFSSCFPKPGQTCVFSPFDFIGRIVMLPPIARHGQQDTTHTSVLCALHRHQLSCVSRRHLRQLLRCKYSHHHLLVDKHCQALSP